MNIFGRAGHKMWRGGSREGLSWQVGQHKTTQVLRNPREMTDQGASVWSGGGADTASEPGGASAEGRIV